LVSFDWLTADSAVIIGAICLLYILTVCIVALVAAVSRDAGRRADAHRTLRVLLLVVSRRRTDK
jgi:hypothetical protein